MKSLALFLALSLLGAQVSPALGQPAQAADETPAPTRPGGKIDQELEEQAVAAEQRGLVTRTSDGRTGAHVLWAVLLLPERLVEALFLPVGAALVVAERYQLPSRLVDALQNDEETIVLTPKIKISTGQGLGVGATLKLQSKLASQARFKTSALIELDRDYEVGVEYQRRVARLNGRLVSLAVDYETERGNDFYGIGDATLTTDRRELGINDLRGGLEIELSSRAAEYSYGTGRVEFLRQKLYPGSGSQPPVGEPGDDVAPPPGFDEIRQYAVAGFDTFLDSRDTEGRTSQGYLVELSGRFTLDVADVRSNAVTAKASGALFFPIAGRNRTLVFSAGAGIAEAVTGDNADMPLDSLIILGRSAHLAGYSKDRFRVTRAIWGHGEYRYPIWYLSSNPVVLTTRLFADVAREGDSFEDIIEAPVRYSFGAGFVVELYHSTVTGVQIAGSPEGFEFVFTAGTPL